jgi:hypothetical protein
MTDQKDPSTPKIGDYVLATKYHDGDPGDPWALGFYAGVLKWTEIDGIATPSDRHLVKDGAGQIIRPGGYRRVARVRGDVGNWMLRVASKQLEESPPGTVNLWSMLTDAAFDLDQDTLNHSSAAAQHTPDHEEAEDDQQKTR